MDTNFGLLLNIGNRSEKVSKNIKFRYLYPIEIRNHGIYVWTIIKGLPIVLILYPLGSLMNFQTNI